MENREKNSLARRLEVEACRQVQTLDEQVAVGQVAARLFATIGVMTEHVLVPEHLETIGCQEVKVPIVVVEIRTPAEAHFKISMWSQGICVVLVCVECEVVSSE